MKSFLVTVRNETTGFQISKAIRKVDDVAVVTDLPQNLDDLAALRTALAEARELLRPLGDWNKIIYASQDDDDIKDIWLKVGQIRAAAAWLAKQEAE